MKRTKEINLKFIINLKFKFPSCQKMKGSKMNEIKTQVGELIAEWNLEDDNIDEWAWLDFCEHINNAIMKKNPSGEWYAEVKNFGWRSLDGYKYFHAETAEEILHQILPKCECIFKIFEWENGIAIQNWHHDSTTGNEWYYISPKKEKTNVR